MGIPLCHLDIGMAKQFAHLKERHNFHLEPTGKGVAQVMDSIITPENPMFIYFNSSCHF